MCTETHYLIDADGNERWIKIDSCDQYRKEGARSECKSYVVKKKAGKWFNPQISGGHWVRQFRYFFLTEDQVEAEAVDGEAEEGTRVTYGSDFQYWHCHYHAEKYLSRELALAGEES